ncbi:TetR family transcriptional regulator [Azorhizobium oxalatiphilum]|uniref:TetR family transcriptional regulator n=1 Tax=Azorhizobium oxalatiphilum TaxID=980631 RepID=A0A917C1Q9_9HYPH|nr:TetR/AcrR family transcriptional regulator [Azorhizobium oxalatiphilum]GGF64617.1 TetR family transcriptional regulator [Azorhizobium oxalatiphilum]
MGEHSADVAPKGKAAPRRTSIGGRRNPASASAILEAAEAILSETGLAGFSIEAVARRAGAGKPTIYRWWPNRSALLMDVYARQKETVLRVDTGTLEGDLVELLTRLFAFWRDTPAGATFRSIIAEAQSDPASLAALQSFLADRRAYVGEVVARGIARGDLPPKADLPSLVELIFGFAWMRLLTGDIAAPDADHVPDALPARVRLLLRGAAATA